jgi:hypothetical protein
MTRAPIYTDLQLASYAGASGESVEFIGHGYVPNDSIELRTDRTGSAPVATWSADAAGDFDFTGYALPADLTEGNLTFTVTGTNSFDTKSIVYYVTGP